MARRAVTDSDVETLALLSQWRVGRSLGFTLYAQMDYNPSYNDVYLGMMDTPELAEHVVRLHNAGII